MSNLIDRKPFRRGSMDPMGKNPVKPTQQIRDNFFQKPSTPLINGGMNVVNDFSRSNTHLPPVDNSDGFSEAATRSQKNFRVKRPNVGDPDFDYSHLNTNLKIRDLEKKVIEMKTQMERQVLQIIEENPKRIMQHLRSIEEKETNLWAENMQRHNKNYENVENLKLKQDNNLTMIHQQMQDMKRHIEDLSFKNIELSRNMASLASQSKSAFQDNILAIEDKHSQGSVMHHMANEIKSLKERLQNQEQSKNDFFKDIMSQYQNMNDAILKNEKEYFGRLREQKEEITQEQTLQKNQFKNLEAVRMEKLLGDNEYVKGLVDSLDRRVKDEIQKRLAQEFENKQWMDRQLKVFKDEIKNDEREILANENRFIQEVQETISSMNSIVKNTREQLEANIAGTQTMMTENLRNVAKTMEILKENMFTKMGVLDSSMVELNKRMANTVEAFNEHSLNTNETLEKEFARVETMNKRIETLVSNTLGELGLKMGKNEEYHEAWRKNFEDKNHNFFTELTNAMKSLKKQLVREKFERKTTDDGLRDLIENNKKHTDKICEDLDRSIKHQEETFDFKMKKNNEKWESHVQLEVDKLLDAISKNSEQIRQENDKKLARKTSELQNEFDRKLTTESADLREFIMKKKGEIEEDFVQNLKDLENRLTIKWSTLFDSYRVRFDESMRELNILKNDLLLIKKDYMNEIARIEEKFQSKLNRDLDHLRSQFVNRLSDQQEETVKYVEGMMKKIRDEMELNKNNLSMTISEVKSDIKAEADKTYNKIGRAILDTREKLREEMKDYRKQNLQDLELTKKMLMERMNEMNESTKSLARALVLEEAALRAKEDEHIIKLFDRKLHNIEKYLTSLIEQTADKLRIEFDQKLKDLSDEFKEFILWTINTFSDVRTEAEEFKNEYYARSFAEYLMNMAFQAETGQAFMEIKQQLAVIDSDLEDIEKLIKEEAEERQKQDQSVREALDEHKEVFNEYKELNEQTWNEHILDNQTSEFMQNIKLQLMEQHIFDSMHSMYDELKDIGLDLEQIEQRVDLIETDAKNFKADVAKQNTANKKRFEEDSTRMDEADKKFEEFSDSVESNFEVTEQSLFQLNNFCNALDSKVMTDDIMTRACLNNHDGRLDVIEASTVTEMAVLQQEMKLNSEKLKDGVEKDMKKMEKKIVEDVIPSQVLNINNAMEEIRNAQKEQMKSANQDLEKKMKSLESTADELDDRLQQNEADIKQLQKDMEQAENVVQDTNAVVIMDKAARDSEIMELRENVQKAIEDIFEAMDDFETSQKQGNQNQASADSQELKKVKDQLKDMEGRLKKAEKNGDKLDGLTKDVKVIQTDFKKIGDKPAGKAAKGDDAQIKDITKKFTKLEDRVAKLEEATSEKGGKAADSEKGGKGKKEIGKSKGGKKAKDEEEDEDNDHGERIEELESQMESLQKEVKLLKKNGGNKTDYKNGKSKAKKDDDEEEDEEQNQKIEELEEEIDEIKERLEKIEGGAQDKKGSKPDKKDDKKAAGGEKNSDDERFKKIETRLDKLEKSKGVPDDKTDKKGKKAKDEDDEEKVNKQDFDDLQSQVEDLMERLEALEEGKDDDESDKKGKSKGKNKGKKDDDEDDGDKVTRDEFEELKERLDELENKSEKSGKGSKKSEGGLDEIKERLDEMQEAIDELRDKEGSKKGGGDEGDFEELKERIDELEEKIDKLDGGKSEKSGADNLDDLKEQIEEMKTKVEELEEKIEELGNKSEKGSGKGGDYDEKIEELENKIEELAEKLEDGGGGKGDIDADEFNDLKEKVEGFEEKINGIEDLENKISDLEQKIEELEDK